MEARTDTVVPQLPELLALLEQPGPFVTVLLDLRSDLPDAAERVDKRITAARTALDRQGLDPERVDAVAERLSQVDHDAGAAVCLLQAAGGEPLVAFLDDPLEHDLVAVDDLPRLGPLLESRQRSRPHVIVVADRTGADIVAVGPGHGSEEVTVEGETLHIQRSHPGGWSQRRFQQRAENRWESNAGEVADAVAACARQIGAELVTVAGDVRAVGFLLDQLPPDVAALTARLEGGSPEAVADETVRLVADGVARRTRSLLEGLRTEQAQDRGVQGLRPTLAALAEGRVDTLLVHDDPADDRRAAFSPSGLWCGPVGVTATDAAPEDATEGRLVDVAVRSALSAGASVWFVPHHGGPDDGLGALLRW